MGAIDRVHIKPSPRELEARFLEVLADERLREGLRDGSRLGFDVAPLWVRVRLRWR